MDILFAPKPQVRVTGFGNLRIEGDKVIGSLVAEVKLPDPKQCVIVRNVELPKGGE